MTCPAARVRPVQRALAVTLLLACAGLARGQAPGTGETVASEAGGIARFVENGVDAKSLAPSVALARPAELRTTGPAKDAKVAPLFWRAADGRNCARIDVPAGTSLYGTGEIAGPLLRNGRKSVCWNTDAYGYTEEYPSLYQSHPWVLAVRPDGTAFGVLADTTWRCEIDLTGAEKGEGAAGSIVFRGEGGDAGRYAVYVIDRASPQDVVKGLAELVGTMPMPPKWAIGYHQCRYSYNPEARVREIAEGFRSRHIPCDVIWFDIDYMDQYKVFTFDAKQFPDVKGLNADLEKQGFHRIWMIDPGVKVEKGYALSDQLESSGLMVRAAAGEPYKGEVWPGWCYFPDYTNPKAREWWGGLYKGFMAQGVSGVWNDMNEPAVFNVKSKTMPEDNRHAGGAWNPGAAGSESAAVELPAGPHLKYHNVYGLMMAKGTYDGILAARPENRPFVLTRAGYMGSHRYAATWTGDNSAEWRDLEASVPMALNMGLSGSPFVGPDIGGFNGNGPTGKDEAETKLLRGRFFARWMGVGALLPFSRGHTGKGNIDKEPWAFGPEVEQTCRLALQRRYRLMPYLYTLFHEASTTGLPVVRPVFFADPKDPALRTEDDAFLLGGDLLVVPQLTPGSDRAPALPKGIWNEVMLVEEGHHPDLPRLYVRGGAIVPIGPVLEWTGQKPLDPLTLLVSLDETGTAVGTLYEDDGDDFSYLRGNSLTTTYVARKTGNVVKVEIASKEGRFVRNPRDLRVMILQNGTFVGGAGTDGMSLSFPMNELTPQRFKEEPPAAPTGAPAAPASH